jgi:hypothetical protein
MEEFHGRAVRLYPDNPRTPFHGAFVDQEMRTRGRYPYQPAFADRPIELPIPWQTWITDAPGGHDGEATADTGPAGDIHEGQKPTTITFTNPMTNPSELEAVIRSARQQPNWKAAVIEGESWEDTAEENIAKYRRVMLLPDTV